MPQDIKISELPETTVLAGNESLPLVQSGQTRRATVSTLRSGLAAAAHTHPASAIADASAAGRSLLTAADAAAQRTALGLGSLAIQAASAVAVTGGSINGTAIGATTPAVGTFSNLTITTGGSLEIGRTDGVSTNPYIDFHSGAVSTDFDARVYTTGGTGTTGGGTLTFWAAATSVSASGTERLRVTASDVKASVPLLPTVDNTYSLGSSGLRWKDVYAGNAVIQTSDARAKTDVADCPLGLDFILALRPVRYRFADIDEPAVTVRRTVERPVTAPATRTREEVRCVDGQYRLDRVTETTEEPVQQLVPLFDAEGRPLADEDGTPRRYAVPVTETMEVEEVVRPAFAVHHRRPHDGLIAQEVKGVLDRLGLDMAGYIHDPESDRHGLRYAEFIAPLIRAVQELAGRVAVLERATAG